MQYSHPSALLSQVGLSIELSYRIVLNQRFTTQHLWPATIDPKLKIARCLCSSRSPLRNDQHGIVLGHRFAGNPNGHESMNRSLHGGTSTEPCRHQNVLVVEEWQENLIRSPNNLFNESTNTISSIFGGPGLTEFCLTRV